ncbi:Hpr(Ser) kinase/phosphatase [Caminicella sporogenes DSM 14501]|uniref:HPr kinase/phosphorylase n=1 Tax=Caminicella sporogenes DSM 14501 TaxID=1121266 RepID=A0A1M6QLW5_9FIRM|nr:HPr(Ser) kinase/phosphatase [Caminicella sporogenes]RKD25266.1 HPr kinase/phosphorylase [Caminicella sporogenes]WIF95259.1 HPr(Ser) kinase/phosphatase [Caminicella sporogenes]SHK21231.1 Hpr(Ser) kinase/phosphatase [Caminicella sporogenes DSM 14501]
MQKIAINKFVKDLNLEVINEWKGVDISITTSEVNRPGLLLAGYYEHFAYERVQIIGRVEWSYFNKLSGEERKSRARKLMEYDIPCLIISRGMKVFDEFLEEAKNFNRPIFRTNLSTTKFISKLINYLEDRLAPTTTLHGVLVEVNGIGVLILGQSGIGKSETALELVKRGHRLVADDAVKIKKIDENKLVGTAPEIIKYFLEIRGIGIMDIAKLYGMGAVRDSKVIDMVVQLESYSSDSSYDRLGLEENFMEILGVNISRISIPVRPGRNLAVIIEAAARNHRQKEMGYNAAEELNMRFLSLNYSDGE